MIIDTSAIIAILSGEPERGAFVTAIAGANARRMSAATYLEAALVIDRLSDPVIARRFDQFLDLAGIEIVDVTAQQARVARAAYRDYAKGSGHPARLNYGDCFTYALASVTGEPVLFKGDDFSHTDVASADSRDAP